MLERLTIPAELDGEVWPYRVTARQHPMHRHRELELNIMLRGQASYLLADERRYELGSGSILWLFPGQEHVIARQSPDHRMWIVIFRPSMLTGCCREPDTRVLRRRNPAGVFCRKLSSIDASRLDALAVSVHRSRDAAATFNAGLGFLLLSAWQAFGRSGPTPDGADVHPAVRGAARWLNCDEGLALSVDELARRLDVGADRLSHLFHRQMGVRLSEFRNRRRMDRFVEIYGDGSRINLLDAAIRAGFGSYAQFYRVFRKTTGQGPRDFRR